MWMSIFPVCMPMYHVGAVSSRSEEGASKILALQVVVSYHVGVQGIIKPWSSGRVTSILNYEAILPHYYIFKDI